MKSDIAKLIEGWSAERLMKAYLVSRISDLILHRIWVHRVLWGTAADDAPGAIFRKVPTEKMRNPRMEYYFDTIRAVVKGEEAK